MYRHNSRLFNSFSVRCVMKLDLTKYTYEQMYFYIKHHKGTSNKVLAKKLKVEEKRILDIKGHIVNRILEDMPLAKSQPNNTYILKESELLYLVPTFDEIKQEYKELNI